MKRFLVLYRTPTSVIDAWMKKAPEERKEAEETMQKDWQRWANEHASLLKETAGIGKVKCATTGTVTDTRNDIMLFSIVEAESHEEAADIFKNHPHLGIPDSTIEIMPITPISEMQQ